MPRTTVDQSEKDRMAERIRSLRIDLGLTKAEFARKVGLDGSAITRIESGESYIALDTARNIARLFNVTVDEL